ncbi:MAG: hypothetical protein LBQ54_09535 [Planctomycetaceae bacterium]|jgi:hypothetical protein|nr:hypothetical protein [Planctomycetaceae bacterium]
MSKMGGEVIYTASRRSSFSAGSLFFSVSPAAVFESRTPDVVSAFLCLSASVSLFARQNPTLCPQYLDMYLFDIDFADAHGLWTLLNTATQLQENIDDTAMCAGNESYQAGRDAAAGGSLPTPSVWSASVRKIFPPEAEWNAVTMRQPRCNGTFPRSRWSLISTGRTKGKWLEKTFHRRPNGTQ